jgi:hypothetical protein
VSTSKVRIRGQYTAIATELPFGSTFTVAAGKRNG